MTEATNTVRWISFDGTVPVPALVHGPVFALSRESVIDLFEGTDDNVLRFEKDAVVIEWNGEEDRFPAIDIEGVQFYDFLVSSFEYNHDDEQVAELGYSAYFVPGGGIVVTTPDTPARLAADRILEDLRGIFGMYTPERLNSWAEYAAAVPNLDRVFFFAGVERHEKQKMALVGQLVDGALATRAATRPTANTVRADELAAGDVLEAVDVRWWSHMPARETFTVAAIERAADGTFTATFVSSFGASRTRTAISADRRFTKAV